MWYWVYRCEYCGEEECYRIPIQKQPTKYDFADIYKAVRIHDCKSKNKVGMAKLVGARYKRT